MMEIVLFILFLACASYAHPNRFRREADVVYARCNDVYPQCFSWKEQQNWCTSDQYREYMATVCPLTCGFCVKEDPVPDPVPLKAEPSPEQASHDDYKKQMEQYYTDIQRLQSDNLAAQQSSLTASNTAPASTAEQALSYAPVQSSPSVDAASVYLPSPVNPDPQSVPYTSEVQSVPTATVFSYPPPAPPASVYIQPPQAISAPVANSPTTAQVPQSFNQNPVQPLLNYAPSNPANVSVTYTAAIGQNVTALKAPINTLMMGQLMRNENDSKPYNPKQTSSALYSEKKPQKEVPLESPKNSSVSVNSNTVNKEITPLAVTKDKKENEIKEENKSELKVEQAKSLKKIGKDDRENEEATNEQIRTESKHLEKNLSQAKEKRLRAELQAKAKKINSSKKDVETIERDFSGSSFLEQSSKDLDSIVPKLKLRKPLKSPRLTKSRLKKMKDRKHNRLHGKITASSKHFSSSEFLKSKEEDDLDAYTPASENEYIQESGSESGVGAEGEFEDALAKDLEELSFITGLNFDDDDYDVADDISNEIQHLDSKKKAIKSSVEDSPLSNTGVSTERSDIPVHHVNVRSDVPFPKEAKSSPLYSNSAKSNIPLNNQLSPAEVSSEEDLDEELESKEDDNLMSESDDITNKKSKVIYHSKQSKENASKLNNLKVKNLMVNNSKVKNSMVNNSKVKNSMVNSSKVNYLKANNAKSKKLQLKANLKGYSRLNSNTINNAARPNASFKLKPKPRYQVKSRNSSTNAFSSTKFTSSVASTKTSSLPVQQKILLSNGVNSTTIKNSFKVITAVRGSKLIANSEPSVTSPYKVNTQTTQSNNRTDLAESFKDEDESSSSDVESGSASGDDLPGVLPSIKENSNKTISPTDILATSKEGKLIKVISKASTQEGKISFVLKQNFNTLFTDVHSPNYMMLSGNVKKDLEKALQKGKIEDISFSEADIEGNPRQTGKTKVSFNIKSRQSLIRILMQLVDSGSINGLAVVKGSMEYDDK